MSKMKFAKIGLLFLLITLMVFVIGNFSDIYANQIYKYEPCLMSSEPTPKTVTIMPTAVAYPAEKELITQAYPVATLPTATPVICSCESEWVTASFSALNVQYPKEALWHIDSEEMSLWIPTCQGGKESGFVSLRTIANDEHLNVVEYVNKFYSEMQEVKFREIVVDETKSVEVYQTPYSKNRIVFIPQQSKIIMIELNVTSRGSMMPDSDGEIWLEEPSWEALGFFQKILDTIEFVE